MAGRGIWEPELTEQQGLAQELAYRNDLAAAIGIIVTPPPHHIDEDGNIRWGRVDNTSTGDSKVYSDLNRALADAADQVLRSSASLPSTDRKAPTHNYEIPPAAQSWQEIAVLLWENGKPYLENSDLVLSLALAVRELVRMSRSWFDEKNQEISELNRPDYEAGRPSTHQYVELDYKLTQGAIVALVVADLVDRFGFNEDLRVDVFPRGPEGYNDPGHPNPHLSYLVRCSFSERVLVYIISAAGQVTEHFQLTGSEITPLPAPVLLVADGYPLKSLPGTNGLHLRSK